MSIRSLSHALATLVGVAASLAAAPAPSAAQRAVDTTIAAAPGPFDAPVSRSRVLFLGTFHFDNPNRDAYKQRYDVDILSPARQREVEDVAAGLAAFRPTRIAVEWPRERQAALDSLYREYRAGRLAPRAGEVFQLGFRLAARLGHERVYAIDVERNQLLMDAIAPYERDLEIADSSDAWRATYKRLYAWEDSAKAARPLRAHLRYVNAPATIRRAAGAYLVRTFKGGGDTSYVGPDFIAGWYDRNLRIFRNIQRISSTPDERILVIYGSGHLATLRHFVESSPEYRLEEVERYLAPVRR